jgi:predicted regulator of Ras-like GTPase activity (Roadblock/LC7/MglB family)/thioredoxin-like negative regulator of GroEL
MSDEIRRLSDELARDPGSLVFMQLAEALRRDGQLDHASRIAARGVERHPTSADAHDLLARIAADRGDVDRASSAWEAVLRLAPTHVGARKGLGFLCFQQGRLEEAEAHLSDAAHRDPSDAGVAAALTHVRASRRPKANVASVKGTTAKPDVASRVRSPASSDDPRMLFAELLHEADQTAVLLDRDGLVLGGAYFTWDGRDVAQEVGAALSGVSDEADRATKYLGIGEWSMIVVETEAAAVAIAPTEADGLVVLAAGSSTPLGLTQRLLERCVARARAWLGRVA